MDSKSPEHVEFSPRIVALNEDFQPFDPKSTREVTNKYGTKPEASEIILKTDFFSDMAFYPDAYTFIEKKFQVIFPFHPNLSYSISRDDFRPKERKKKIENDPKNLINISKGFSFGMGVYYDDPDKKIIPGETAQLERLRLQVELPIGSYESKPDIEFGYDPVTLSLTNPPILSEVVFSEFYPLETGPLADVNEIGFYSVQGVSLAFLNLEELQQIKARFIIAPRISGK